LSYVATTTQNPQLASFDANSFTSGVWTSCTYLYFATKSATVNLKFSFEASTNDHWCIDDVSIQNPTLTEMLSNGNFESTPSLTGWTSGCSPCSFGCALTTSGCHSASNCYCNPCVITTTSLQQSFTVTNGQIYNFTFWLYLKSNGGTSSMQMYATIS
jgi:hypothetical protein